ncbi:MAG: MFS transporter [Euryarchaeota archaeon]|nr:MFS transporter [Euryarchaeota archaeon]
MLCCPVNRKLIYLSSAFLLANMGWGMAWPYLPNYMRVLGGSMLFIALLSVLFNLFSTIGQYFWGRSSDASGRRKPYILGGVLASGIFFLLMALVQNAVAMLALRAMQGFFVSAQTPAVSALVSELSENVGQGFGIFNLFSNVGFMLGNLAGGLAVGVLGVRYVILLSTIAIGAAFIMLLFFKEEPKEVRDYRLLFRYDRPGRMALSFTRMREFAKRNRNITIMTLSIFVLMLASGMVYAYLSILISHRFGDSMVGLYFGMDGFVSSFLIYPFGRLSDKIGSKPVIILGLITYALTFYFYYIATTLILLIIAAIISGTKWSAYFNSINTYVSKMSSRAERATSLGLMNSGMAAGWVVGPLLGAYLIATVGLATMVLLATIPVLISLLIVLFRTENDLRCVNGEIIK